MPRKSKERKREDPSEGNSQIRELLKQIEQANKMNVNRSKGRSLKIEGNTNRPPRRSKEQIEKPKIVTDESGQDSEPDYKSDSTRDEYQAENITDSSVDYSEPAGTSRTNKEKDRRVEAILREKAKISYLKYIETEEENSDNITLDLTVGNDHKVNHRRAETMRQRHVEAQKKRRAQATLAEANLRREKNKLASRRRRAEEANAIETINSLGLIVDDKINISESNLSGLKKKEKDRLEELKMIYKKYQERIVKARLKARNSRKGSTAGQPRGYLTRQRLILANESAVERTIRKCRLDLLASVSRSLETTEQREARFERNKVGSDTSLTPEERASRFKKLYKIVKNERDQEREIRFKLVTKQLLMEFDPDDLQSTAKEMGLLKSNEGNKQQDSQEKETTPVPLPSTSTAPIFNSNTMNSLIEEVSKVRFEEEDDGKYWNKGSDSSDEDEEEQKKWPDESLEDWTLRLSSLLKIKIESQKDKTSKPAAFASCKSKTNEAYNYPLQCLIQQKSLERSFRIGNLDELKNALTTEKADRVSLYEKELEVKRLKLSKESPEVKTQRLKEALEANKELIFQTRRTDKLKRKTKDPLEFKKTRSERELERKKELRAMQTEEYKAQKRKKACEIQAMRNKIIKDEWSLFFQLFSSPSPGPLLETQENKKLCEVVYNHNFVSMRTPAYVDIWRRKLFLMSNEILPEHQELEEEKAERISRNGQWIKDFLGENDNQKKLEKWLYDRRNSFNEYQKKRFKSSTPEQREKFLEYTRERYRKKRLEQGKGYTTAVGRRGPRPNINYPTRTRKLGYPPNHIQENSKDATQSRVSFESKPKPPAPKRPKRSAGRPKRFQSLPTPLQTIIHSTVGSDVAEVGDSMDCSSLNDDWVPHTTTFETDSLSSNNQNWGLQQQIQNQQTVSTNYNSNAMSSGFQNPYGGIMNTNPVVNPNPIFNNLVTNLSMQQQQAQQIAHLTPQNNMYDNFSNAMNISQQHSQMTWNQNYPTQQQHQSQLDYSLQFHSNHQVSVISTTNPTQILDQRQSQWDQIIPTAGDLNLAKFSNPTSIQQTISTGTILKPSTRQRKTPGPRKKRVSKKQRQLVSQKDGPFETSEVSSHSEIEEAVSSILQPPITEVVPESPEPTPLPDPLDSLPPLPKCPHCLISFENENILSNHIKGTHFNMEGAISCKICSKLYKRKEYLVNHIWKSHYGTDKSKECPFCYKTFSKHCFSQVIYHVKKAHPVEANWYIIGAHHSKTQVQANQFNCLKCDERFEGFLELHNHSIIAHSYGCKFCGIILRLDHLKEHVATFHPNEILGEVPTQLKAEEVVNSFNCTKCDSKFLTNELLFQHQKQGHFTKECGRSRCNSCNFCFKKKDLRLHQDRGCPIRVFKCYWCEDIFEDNKSLQNHLSSTHPKEKKIPARVPSGHYDYKCELCYREYSSLVQMRKHFLSYHDLQSKEKGYETEEEIQKLEPTTVKVTESNQILASNTINNEVILAFPGSSKAPLTSTKAKASVEKTYSCLDCDTSFNLEDFHILHREYEKKARKYCYVCNNQYESSALLTKHNKTVHKISSDPIIPTAEIGMDTINKALETVASNAKDSLHCLKCGFVVDPTKFHQQHIEFTPLIEAIRLVCEVCGVKFMSKRSYTRHQRNFHDGVNQNQRRKFQTPNSKNKTKTVPINNSYEVPSIAITEPIEAHGSLVYPCVACTRKFQTEDFLRKHFAEWHPWTEKKIQTYIQSKNYCKLCHKSYASRDTLQKHEKLVHGDKCFQCSHCSLKDPILGHIRKHIDRCHKNEDAHAYIVERELTNKDDDPFKCKICLNMSFKTEAKLRLHILNLHKMEISKFCEFCGLQVSPINLRDHRTKSCRAFRKRNRKVVENSTEDAEEAGEINNPPEETKKLSILEVLKLVEEIWPDRIKKKKPEKEKKLKPKKVKQIKEKKVRTTNKRKTKQAKKKTQGKRKRGTESDVDEESDLDFKLSDEDDDEPNLEADSDSDSEMESDSDSSSYSTNDDESESENMIGSEKMSLKDIIIKPEKKVEAPTVRKRLRSLRSNNAKKKEISPEPESVKTVERISKYGVSILNTDSNIQSVKECMEQKPVVVFQRCDKLIEYFKILTETLRKEKLKQPINTKEKSLPKQYPSQIKKPIVKQYGKAPPKSKPLIQPTFVDLSEIMADVKEEFNSSDEEFVMGNLVDPLGDF